MTSRSAGHDPGTSVCSPRAVRLLCEVCAREFDVPTTAYRSLSGIVPCPRCGCLDLVLIDPGDDAGGRS